MKSEQKSGRASSVLLLVFIAFFVVTFTIILTAVIAFMVWPRLEGDMIADDSPELNVLSEEIRVSRCTREDKVIHCKDAGLIVGDKIYDFGCSVFSFEKNRNDTIKIECAMNDVNGSILINGELAKNSPRFEILKGKVLSVPGGKKLLVGNFRARRGKGATGQFFGENSTLFDRHSNEVATACHIALHGVRFDENDHCEQSHVFVPGKQTSSGDLDCSLSGEVNGDWKLLCDESTTIELFSMSSQFINGPMIINQASTTLWSDSALYTEDARLRDCSIEYSRYDRNGLEHENGPKINKASCASVGLTPGPDEFSDVEGVTLTVSPDDSYIDFTAKSPSKVVAFINGSTISGLISSATTETGQRISVNDPQMHLSASAVEQETVAIRQDFALL